MSTTRRAFLAAAFGSATARAVPKPLKIMFTKVDYATKTVTVTRIEDFAQWGPVHLLATLNQLVK